MEIAIEILSSALMSTDEKIRNGNVESETLIKKAQLQEAIRWLTQLQQVGVNWKHNRVIRLKDIGYCDYRLLVDDETDNRDSWTEIPTEGPNGFKLSSGDVLIIRR